MSLKSGLRRLAPRTIRAHRILGGHLRGRIIVTSLHDYPAAIFGRTESALIEWFRETVQPGETWLDIGAHYGYTAIALAELVGHSGHVFAFEPSLTTAGYLNRTRGLNGLGQITVLPFGLGEPGDIRVVRVPIERGMANHLFGGSDTENILVVGFDNLWSRLRQGSIHGVKIDVQGMESEVLEGMKRTLAEHHPKLVVEFHAGADRNRILDLMEALGYRLPGIVLEQLTGEREAGYHDNHSYAFIPTAT